MTSVIFGIKACLEGGDLPASLQDAVQYGEYPRVAPERLTLGFVTIPFQGGHESYCSPKTQKKR